MSNTTNNESEKFYTPYAATKVVNMVLEEAGLKSIPPQMMYNYTSARVRAGKAPLVPVTMVGQQVQISESDLKTWVAKYIAKKVANTIEV